MIYYDIKMTTLVANMVMKLYNNVIDNASGGMT